ncbi:TetR/AcrR family transcriptional regulator [Okibacterium endophyticum]
MAKAVGETKGTDRRAGLTPARIIDAAQELSRGTGLNSWTQRDLAATLNVAPSVLYHHIGSRGEIVRGVVERILTEIPSPDPSLEWQEWFRRLLYPLRPIVREYPGTAKWLLMHGPSFPRVAATFDAGIASLSRAGFGQPALAYALLINSAMLTVTISDDRLELADDGPRDHGSMLEEFTVLAEESTGVSQVISEMIAPLADTDETSGESVNDAYYGLLVESLLVGLGAQLRPS